MVLSLRQARALPLAALALAPVYGACGGGGKAASSSNSSPASAPPAQTATQTQTQTRTRAAAPAPGAGSVRVVIAGFAYRPRTIRVRPGTRVTWVNRDTTNHTVTATGGQPDLGNVNPGSSVSRRFTKPGRFTYTCSYHPFMRGTVVVG